MQILNSRPEDLPAILNLYEVARDFMKLKKQVSWPLFPDDLVPSEIKQNRQWKLLIDGQIACVWATALDDKLIWGSKNDDPSVYIHRIATNPNFRGRRLVNSLVEWANAYGKANNLKYIRMDTVGLNEGLIAHYKKVGFQFLGTTALENTEGLPDHYKEGDVCLFQKEVS